MHDDVVMVLDCGATNARAIAVSANGDVLAHAGRPNAPSQQPDAAEGWLIWDLEQLWGKLAEACREACAQLGSMEGRARVNAVTVTTFGADGAPVDAAGQLTHPVISWQCSRTEPTAQEFAEMMDPWEAFALTGYQVIPFDTLLRLIWLRENAPEALDRAESFLMTPGLLSMKLCGERSIDPTIASTMMAMDLAARDWSETMLGLAEVSPALFPAWRDPGAVIGAVTPEAADQTGLPAGIPVTAAGHDTQFAAIGSGAGPGEAVLSSGTWEILLVRSPVFAPTREGFELGLIYECDAEPGLYNPQLLMMGSAVLEWIRERLYDEVADRSDAYERMIADAETIPAGAGGVTVLPSFVHTTGPTRRHGTRGTILGLGMDTTRGEIYRAGLEGLCFQMRHALEALSAATGAAPEAIRVVGGGARNRLWNQLRADISGLPAIITEQAEATVVGAAMVAFAGIGVYGSVSEAQTGMAGRTEAVEPTSAHERYSELYHRYRLAPPALREFYCA